MAAPKWADYSAGYPGGAALVAAGFVGIIAYIGIGSGPKLITAADYHDAVAHGLKVLLCAELSTRDAEGGYQAGISNALKALNDARSKGIPDSVGIAAVCDEHLTPAQISACVDYVHGFRDVLGQARTGAYGFAEFVDAVHQAGYADWWWKCGAAPTASESQWITFWQQNFGSTVVNKIAVDIDLQFNPISAPTLPPKASVEDMWKFLVDSSTEQADGSYTRCAELRPDGTLIGCDWLDADSKVKENSMTASVRGVPAIVFEDYVVNSDRVKAATVSLGSLLGALAQISVSTSALTPADVSALASSVTAAVTAAVKALPLQINPADVAAVAKASADATVAEFASRLAA
jgi:Domain of unknown function (DUF1906)